MEVLDCYGEEQYDRCYMPSTLEGEGDIEKQGARRRGKMTQMTRTTKERVALGMATSLLVPLITIYERSWLPYGSCRMAFVKFREDLKVEKKKRQSWDKISPSLGGFEDKESDELGDGNDEAS
ncbi:hypothetical protein HAX54_043268, partial [Datura stramonium]|nr:hypothetical protein [Datura stramonium]